MGKGLSPPASPQVLFPVWFSAGLSGSHPLPWGMSLKGVTGRSLPTQQGNIVSLHLPTAVAPVAVGLQGPAPGELRERC